PGKKMSSTGPSGVAMAQRPSSGMTGSPMADFGVAARPTQEPICATRSRPTPGIRPSLLELELLMAGTATHLMQADLLLTLGTTAITRFAVGLGARSSLHDLFSFRNFLASPQCQQETSLAGVVGWLALYLCRRASTWRQCALSLLCLETRGIRSCLGSEGR